LMLGVKICWSFLFVSKFGAACIRIQISRGKVSQWVTCFTIDGAASVVTKIRHAPLFLCWCSTAEMIVYIFLQDLSKVKHCLWPAVLQIFHTKNRWDIGPYHYFNFNAMCKMTVHSDWPASQGAVIDTNGALE
jgi:hypothetical protein